MSNAMRMTHMHARTHAHTHTRIYTQSAKMHTVRNGKWLQTCSLQALRVGHSQASQGRFHDLLAAMGEGRRLQPRPSKRWVGCQERRCRRCSVQGSGQLGGVWRGA